MQVQGVWREDDRCEDGEALGGSAPGRGNTAIEGSSSGCMVLDKKLKLPILLLTYK